MAHATKTGDWGRHGAILEQRNFEVPKMIKASIQFIGTSICLALAASTVVASETLWHLGGTYWLILILLGMVQLIVTGIIFVKSPGQPLLKLGLIVALLIGQLWAIQMIAMQVIWYFGRFAP